MPTGIAASSDQTGYYQDNGQQYQQPQQTPQLALTAPTPTTAQEQQTAAIHLVAPLNNKMSSTPMASTLQSVQQDENKVDIMIDSGAATHVCPPWFAPNTPMYSLEHGQGPQLRTATDENIPAYGYTWVLMTNVNKQQLYSCFLLCARSDTTHLVSSNTGRTRVQHTTQRDTNSLTHTQRNSTQHLFNVMDSTS